MTSVPQNSCLALDAPTSSTLLWSGAKTDKTPMARYLAMPKHENKVYIEYIWIWMGKNGLEVRSKCRAVDHVPNSPEECPVLTFDGSSANYCDRTSLEICLRPVALFSDPFRGGSNKLCLCAVYNSSNQPAKTNHRHSCLSVMQKARDSLPIFGMEQEFRLLDCSRRPLGLPDTGYPTPEGVYYCGVGADRIYGRDLLEAHYRACLYAGIKISGYKAGVMPAQWAYQLGTCEGIDMADQLWMSRYILKRVAEDFNLAISLDPKSVSENLHVAGVHCSFSTKAMRENGGLSFIQEAIPKLERAHKNDIRWYSSSRDVYNAKQQTDNFQSTRLHHFFVGIADRCACIRIPYLVARERKGYLEDRRPSSNSDPYLVIERLVRTVVFGEEA